MWEFFVLFLQLFCKFKIIPRGEKKKSTEKQLQRDGESSSSPEPRGPGEDSLTVGKHPGAERRVQEATLPRGPEFGLTGPDAAENTGLGKGCELRGEGRKMWKNVPVVTPLHKT